MIWESVASSQIAEIGFEEPDTLGMRFKPFKGDTPLAEYHYANVPAKLHAALMAAKDDPKDSIGKFFDREIKKHPELYPFRKIGVVEMSGGGIKVEIDAPGSALARIDGITVADMFTPGYMDPILEAVRTQVLAEAAKLDISTEANRKALASIAYKVAKSKTFVDGQRKAFVAGEKKRLQTIDSEGARIWMILEGIQKEVRQPLTEWENAEKARVKKHEDAVAAIWEMKPHLYPTIDSLKLAIETLEATKTESFDEFSKPAGAARYETLVVLRGELESRQKAEADQKELDRLRMEAAERAKQDEIEAAANAARETAERAQRQAEERAVQAQKALEAEQQASARRAEEAAAEAKRAEERAVIAERERVAAEEKAAQDAAEARAADKRHRAQVEDEAIGALVEHSEASRSQAVTVIEAIRKGIIPHVTISY